MRRASRSKTSLPATTRRASKTPVYKSWEKIEGRTFLIEELPVRNIRAELQKLPLTSAILPQTNRVSRLATAKRQLPIQRLTSAPAKSNRNLLIAQTDLNKQPGFVLDYLQINEGGSDVTLTPGTYWINNWVYFDVLRFGVTWMIKYGSG